MSELLVIVPSRERPRNAARVVRAIETTSRGNTEVLVAVDTDDPQLDHYYKELSGVLFEVPPGGHNGAINSAARYAGRSRFIAKLDDDHVPRTPGWDVAFMEALEEMKVGIVYGNDLHQRERLPTAPAMSREIVDELGYMAPPELQHLFVDNFWLDLGTAAGCIRYLKTVVIEHMHPHAYKALMDPGYARVNSPSQYERDHPAYQQYKAERFRSDVDKITKLIERKQG